MNTVVREDCQHGWINQKRRCQFCGKTTAEVVADLKATVDAPAVEAHASSGVTYPYIGEDEQGRRWQYHADGSIELLSEVSEAGEPSPQYLEADDDAIVYVWDSVTDRWIPLSEDGYETPSNLPLPPGFQPPSPIAEPTIGPPRGE